MAFPQKQQFVFKHFTIVFLSVLPTHFMRRLFTWSLVVGCLQNHPHFLTRSSYIPVRYVCRQISPKSFCLGGDVFLKLYEQKNLPCNSNMADSQMSHDMTKPTKWLCAERRLRSAWASAQSDQSSLSAWRKLGFLATHSAHSEDTDQTGRIWSVFAGRTLILLVFSCRGSNGSDIPAMSVLLCVCSYYIVQP